MDNGLGGELADLPADLEEQLKETTARISYKSKKSDFILPTVFLCLIMIISIVNLRNFRLFYNAAIEANPDNRQKALAGIESTFAGSFAAKNNFIDLNGLWARIMDQAMHNNVLTLKNGMLTQEVDINLNTINNNANSLIKFVQLLDGKDIPFVYVQAPYKVPSNTDVNIPAGFNMHANERADVFLDKLAEAGISTLDLRELIKEQGIDNYSLFFNTDHHWKVEAGFWAYTQIVPTINNLLNNTAVFEEGLDINNYELISHENIMLGSRGERTGIYYGGVDDITEIKPKFSTNVTREVPFSNYNKTGTFESTMIYPSNLDKKMTTSPYSVYDTNRSYTKNINHEAINDVKLFIIHDSFGLPVSPFLLLQYKEVHQFDMRYNNDNGEATKILIDKLNEIQPDLVIMLLYPHTVANTNAFRVLQ